MKICITGLKNFFGPCFLHNVSKWNSFVSRYPGSKKIDTVAAMSAIDAPTYRAFHRFGQAEFAYVGLILCSSRFSLLPQLPYKQCSSLKWSKSTKNNNFAGTG